MSNSSPDPVRSAEELRHALADLVRSGSPTIGRFAAYALEHPEDIAFYSLRDLAVRAGVNPNTVYRFAVALGYSGFDACRRNFQQTMLRPTDSYSDRARKLADHGEAGLMAGILDSTIANVGAVLAPENQPAVSQAAALLAGAPNVYCIGVRSAFALAHYFSYTGRMAFPSFARPIVEAGSILDVLTGAEAEDVAVLITFALYSNELVRAHRVATERNLKVIAVTDSYASPIAKGAEIVFTLPMQGPQSLPSFTAGFALVEAIVSEMIMADPKAPERIAHFEDRLARHGAYRGARELD